MTQEQTPALKAAEELRLDAKAFRENVVYDSECEPIRLIANAERMEAAASVIEKLCTPDPAVAGLVEAARNMLDGFDPNPPLLDEFSPMGAAETARVAFQNKGQQLFEALKTWSAQ